MGSVIKTVTGALGAVTGGILDGISSTADTSGLDAAKQQTLQREAAANANLTALQPQQAAFGAALAKSAAGQGPSLVGAQLQQTQQANLAQQLAAARSTRGVNPALAARQQQMGMAQQGQALVGQTATAGLAEQQQNQNSFQNYLSSQQGYQANLLNAANGAANAQAAAATSAANSRNQMTGSLIGAGGSALAMMSDKNQKKNVQKADSTPKYNQGGVVAAQYDPVVNNTFEKMMSQFSSQGQNGVSAGLDQASGAMMKAAAAKKPAEAAMPVGAPIVTTSDVMMNAPNYLNPSATGPQMQQAPVPKKYNPFIANNGGIVPGQPVVPGDSPKNDIIDAKVSPGELIIKRSVVAKGPEAIAKFAVQELAKENKKNGVEFSEGGVVPDKDFNPKSFLDALQAYSYEYKDTSKPGTSEGRKLSVMAQDLEKAGPVGKSMVKPDAEGNKIVDYGAGFGAILAAQTDLNKRLSEIETKYGKKKAE